MMIRLFMRKRKAACYPHKAHNTQLYCLNAMF